MKDESRLDYGKGDQREGVKQGGCEMRRVWIKEEGRCRGHVMGVSGVVLGGGIGITWELVGNAGSQMPPWASRIYSLSERSSGDHRCVTTQHGLQVDPVGFGDHLEVG